MLVLSNEGGGRHPVEGRHEVDEANVDSCIRSLSKLAIANQDQRI